MKQTYDPGVLGPAVARRIEPVVDDGRLARAGLAPGLVLRDGDERDLGKMAVVLGERRVAWTWCRV